MVPNLLNCCTYEYIKDFAELWLGGAIRSNSVRLLISDLPARCRCLSGGSAGLGPADPAPAELVQRVAGSLQHGASRHISAHEAVHLLSSTSPRSGLQLGVCCNTSCG
jgi:hypothetical protein